MHQSRSFVNHDAIKQPRIYSIGHSDHSIEAFLVLLRCYQITMVVDVRSQPYSQWTPQFNRESLARALEDAGNPSHSNFRTVAWDDIMEIWSGPCTIA